MKDLASVTLTELSRLSTKDLLTAYNSSAPNPIERFADHPSAFRRTKALWASLQAKAPVTKPVTTKPITKLAPRSGEDRRNKVPSKVLVAPVSHPSANKEYRSVLAAFKALKLPLEKHQRFRRQVKLTGKATFDQFIFTATKK